MPGLLDWLGLGQPQQPPANDVQGLLRDVPPQPPGIGSYGLMGMGMGMLSGGDSRAAWGGAMNGMMQGAQADTAQALKALEYEKMRRQLMGARGFLGQYGGQLNQGQQAAIAADPSIMSEIVKGQLAPQRGQAGPNTSVYNIDPLNPKSSGSVFSTAPAAERISVQRPDGEQMDVYSQPPKPGQLPAGGAMPAAAVPGSGIALPSKISPAAEKFLEKAATERAEQYVGMPQATQSYETTRNALDRLEREAKAIRDDKNLWRSTGALGPLWSAPGSAARDLDARMKTLTSQTGLSALQAMRDASKSGGALGSVTQGEHQILQNNVAALDQGQSPEAYRASLDRLIEYARDSKARIEKAYKSTYGEGNQPKLDQPPPSRPAAVAPEQREAMPDRSEPKEAKSDVVPPKLQKYSDKQKLDLAPNGSMATIDGQPMVKKSGKWVPR
jgi:hypothetical protein